MAAYDYVFLTQWRVPGTPEQVYRIMEDVPAYPRWRPEVWMRVTQLDPVDGLSRYDLHTRGRLPYTLRWQSQTTEKRFPLRLSLAATGDFVGRGIWTFTAVGPDTLVKYDWRLRAEKPLLRHLSWLMKPLFRWNHNWAMVKGLAGLTRELARLNRSG
jgi:hypothetical protein